MLFCPSKSSLISSTKGRLPLHLHCAEEAAAGGRRGSRGRTGTQRGSSTAGKLTTRTGIPPRAREKGSGPAGRLAGPPQSTGRGRGFEAPSLGGQGRAAPPRRGTAAPGERRGPPGPGQPPPHPAQGPAPPSSPRGTAGAHGSSAARRGRGRAGAGAAARPRREAAGDGERAALAARYRRARGKAHPRAAAPPQPNTR